ncbi:hypothetical protein S7711_10278, partial [Stachybotrys chartarum IBT 7711]
MIAFIGFKVWVIAQRGYFLGWVGHRPHSKYGPAGKPPQALRGSKKKPALNPTQSVVPFLLKKLPSASYHVFLDNLFLSPQLFSELRDEGHGATGIARTNCGIFKQLVEAKIRDKKDNALVLLLSTVFTGEEFERYIQWCPTSTTKTAKPVRDAFGDEAVKEMSIPSVTVAYNHEMGAVDLGDQLQATESLQHRIYKGRWQATAWTFLLDTMLVNSYLLQFHVWAHEGPEPRASLTQRDWRHRLIQEL